MNASELKKNDKILTQYAGRTVKIKVLGNNDGILALRIVSFSFGLWRMQCFRDTNYQDNVGFVLC